MVNEDAVAVPPLLLMTCFMTIIVPVGAVTINVVSALSAKSPGLCAACTLNL